MKALAQIADRFPSENHADVMKWLPAPVALRQLTRAVGVTIHRMTFYRWIQSGMLPARKIGYRYFVAAQDVAHFARESFNP